MSSRAYYSLYPDDKDQLIADLELEVSELKKRLNDLNDTAAAGFSSVAEFITVTNLQREIDYLEIVLKKQKTKRQELEDELAATLAEKDLLTEALSSTTTLKDENLVEMMMQQQEARTEELEMARNLIIELQSVAFTETPERVAAQAKDVLVDYTALKKKASKLENERMKAERKMCEAIKRCESLQKATNGYKVFFRTVKEKQKTLLKEKEDEIQELNRKWEEKEMHRIFQARQMMQLLESQINELRVRRLADRDTSSSSMGSDIEIEVKDEIKKKNRMIKSLQDTISDLSRRKSVRPRTEKCKCHAESGYISKEAEAELKSLRQKNAQMATQLKNSEKKAEEKLKMEMDTQSKFFEKKLDEKEKEMEKLLKEMRQMNQRLEAGDSNTEKLGILKAKNEALETEKNHLVNELQTEVVKRKRLFNMCEELKGKVRVYVRVRPLFPNEKGGMCVAFPDEFTILVSTQKTKKEFVFDHIFIPSDTQEAVFSDTDFLIQSAVDGYNVSIFAYGQTGSGKTFTLLGDDKREGQDGIAPRSFKRLFQIISGIKDTLQCKVSVTMLELYNDKLLDLLSENATYSETLEIKRDDNGMVYVPGSTVKQARSFEELSKLFKGGIAVRHIASTKMNAESSRSHLVTSLLIECTNPKTRSVSKGKLSIIDLAGSERISKTGVMGEQLKEATSINMSLSALGDVISALTGEQPFVPYRNNKLTMLMSDSLGGNAKTLMFVNVSPAADNAPETINSLSYGSRVKLIKNAAIKNSESEKIASLRKEVAALQTALDSRK